MTDENKALGSIDRVRKIAVIGGGAMGRGCAQVFAAAGYPVALQSRKLETLAKAVETIRHDLGFLAERGVGQKEDIDAIVARVQPTQSQEEALDGADFVLECVFEDLESEARVVPGAWIKRRSPMRCWPRTRPS